MLDESSSASHWFVLYKSYWSSVSIEKSAPTTYNLYQSMILPMFTYCFILTSTFTRTLGGKINSFERRAYHVIYNRQAVEDIGKVSICRLHRRRLCTQVFDCVKSNVCDNLMDYFEIMSNKTWNADNILRLRYVKLECAKKSFKFSGVKEFDSLLLKLRSAESTKKFISF